VILIAAVSAIAGDNAGFYLGRRFGREALARPGPLWQHRLLAIRRGDRFFERHGPKAVFLARWVALVRFAAAWLAGINRMRFRLFFFWNALGGITWAITYGLVGYYAGEAGAGVLARFGIVGAAVLLIALVAIPVISARRRRRGDAEEPERGSSPPGAQDEAGSS
jgi:membrane-associated protein